MGDFNLDLLKIDFRPHVNMFIETMLTNFFHPHVIQPTRFTNEKNFSLIDNIFYNSLDHRCISGNLLSHITDHLPSFLIIDKSISYSKKAKRFKRDFSKFKINNFINSLEKQNLELVLPTLSNDTNAMYNLFHDSLSEHFNEFLPLKQVSQKELKKLKKPWISNSIIKLIGIKNTLYSKFIQTGCLETLKQYRLARNDINHKIRKSKYQFYKNYFNSNKYNMKKFWKGINNYLNKNQVKNSSPTMIKTETKVLTDPQDIANEFNEYFVQVAPSLVEQLPKQSNKEYYDYLRPQRANNP